MSISWRYGWVLSVKCSQTWIIRQKSLLKQFCCSSRRFLWNVSYFFHFALTLPKLFLQCAFFFLMKKKTFLYAKYEEKFYGDQFASFLIDSFHWKCDIIHRFLIIWTKSSLLFIQVIIRVQQTFLCENFINSIVIFH